MVSETQSPGTGSAPGSSAERPSQPRDRLLRVASELFYREGINAVGVDRIVTQAAVTRATFYRHFPGKEDLVFAYLDREDTTIRSYFTVAGRQADGPAQLLEMIIGGIADDLTNNHTRGCPFINASAEYPDPASPVRVAVAAHREWFRATLAQALQDAGRDQPERRARTLVLLRDAALVGAYLDGPDTIRATFLAAAHDAAGLEPIAE